MTDSQSSYEKLRRIAEPPEFDVYGVSPDARRAFSIAMGNYILSDIHGLWLAPESKDGHCDPQALAVTLGDRASSLCDLYNPPLMGSPIEEQLASALLWCNVDWAGFPCVDSIGAFDRRTDEDGCNSAPTQVDFWLTTQAKIDSYRVDALLWFQCGRSIRGVAVECDGHVFHEKTREQAARDKKRDRDILATGFPVMRFSGSEIYRDVVRCVEQVQRVASDVLYDVAKSAGVM